MSEDTGIEDPDGIHVLHVDDEPGFGDLAAEYLEREDDRLTVETATSAEDADDVLGDRRVDCVISDYDMPGMSGIEFLEHVRAEYPDLPFVLFTGKGSEEVASEAISAGVTDYLQKEGTSDQYAVLANRVRNAVKGYRAEREAERTRTRLAAITENSTEAILTVDEEVVVRFANPAVADIFGHDPDDVVGQSLTMLVPERLREDYSAGFRRYLETDEGDLDWSSTEFTGRHADGHDIPLSVSLREFDIDGQRRFAAVLRDMTDIEESRRRLQTLISNVPGVVYRCRNEPGWPMEQVESECESLTGYPAEALESGAVAWGEDVLHPEDRERIWDAVQETLETGDPFEVTYRIVTADGETRWVWERGRAVDTDDGATALEGFITDITEREERERALAYERDRLAAVFDAVPHPITEVEFRDDEPRVTQVNDAFEEVFGYPEQRVAGESLDDFIVPEEHRAEAKELNESARSRPTVQQEVERVTADGERRTFLFRSSRVSEEHETHWLGTYIDVTERTERERELKRQNERLDQFASVVSHDLRNPLNVASARLELAGDECDSPHLADIADAHRRMEELIDDLLTFARVGTQTIDPGSVDLRRLTEECWETLGDRDATLVVETDRRVRADRDRLKQLLENLVSNAMDHGGADVTVRVGDLGDGFYVADDGPGIPADRREDVFEPGYSTARDGTGFGLSIVRELADLHGWTVRATESESGGVRFEITGVEVVTEF